MSVSDYLSSKAEHEWREQREHKKRVELEHVRPFDCKAMLFDVYKRKGFSNDDCTRLGEILIKDKQTVLEVLLREEDERFEDSTNTPFESASWTFISFVGFGFLPLLTYLCQPYFSFLKSDQEVLYISCLLTLITLLVLGAMRAQVTGKQSIGAGIEMVVVGGGTAMGAYWLAWFLSLLFPAT